MKTAATQTTALDNWRRAHHQEVTKLTRAAQNLSPPASSVLLQRKPNCACGGGCPRCAREMEHGNIQTKLSVDSPGDQYEQEADRVAEQVLTMPEAHSPERSGLHHQSFPIGLQRKCAGCAGGTQDSLKVEKKLVQLKESAAGPTLLNAPSPPQIEISTGSGQPLSASTREFFEPRLGTDLSGVRIHNDARAAESARAVSALAFTFGHDVVFGQGQYAPETIPGKKLLAHELTHTLQQSRSPTVQTILQRKPDDEKDVPAKPPAAKPAACPEFVSLTVAVNSPKVSDSCKEKCRLELGCCKTPRGTCGSTKDSGAAYKGTIKVPAGCTGELAFMQNLVSTDRKRTLTNKSKECVDITSPHADGVFPWKGCQVSVSTAGSHTIESDDCPFLLLQDTMTAASVKDSFKTFLMWKGTNDKDWKTIGMVSWSWSASTTQKKGTDCASKWTAPTGSSAATVKGAASTEVPVAKPKLQGEASKWTACEKKE